MTEGTQEGNYSERRDFQVFEFLRKIEQGKSEAESLLLSLHKLQAGSLNVMTRRAMTEMFVTLSNDFKIFSLCNDDMLIVFAPRMHDEILSCLVKVRFMFHTDPLIKDADDLSGIGFATIYNLPQQSVELWQLVKNLAETQKNPAAVVPTVTSVSATSGNSARRPKRGLTAEMLGKVQKILSVADFSSFIRRQSVCAIIGKSAPQRVFEEVYVAIPDLRDMLLPDVDLTSNPWLFLALSETLDKRVMETISRHDDGSLIGNFSININVSTILSDDFLEFDDNINVSMRSTIILELQLVDIFSDIKAFVLARTFAKARGYKVCIDGITVDKLKYLNRANLDCDLMKIIWHPSFMDVVNEDGHFMDYVNRSERAKMILCRIDDPQAIEAGNSLGINLYQGRYVQKLLSQNAPRTIYKK